MNSTVWTKDGQSSHLIKPSLCKARWINFSRPQCTRWKQIIYCISLDSHAYPGYLVETSQVWSGLSQGWAHFFQQVPRCSVSIQRMASFQKLCILNIFWYFLFLIFYVFIFKLIGWYLRAKISINSFIILHVFRVEATCDKSVIHHQHKKTLKVCIVCTRAAEKVYWAVVFPPRTKLLSFSSCLNVKLFCVQGLCLCISFVVRKKILPRNIYVKFVFLTWISASLLFQIRECNANLHFLALD